MVEYVRVYAWLYTTIEKTETNRASKFDAEGAEYELPEVRCKYLVNHLFSMHPYINTGMGIVPLSWVEIESYLRLNGLEFRSWELVIIKTLSVEYVSQYQDARSPNCPPPTQIVKRDQSQVADKVRNALRG